MKEYYDKQQEENEKQQNSLTNKSPKEIAKPNIPRPQEPTYSYKVPKK